MANKNTAEKIETPSKPAVTATAAQPAAGSGSPSPQVKAKPDNKSLFAAYAKCEAEVKTAKDALSDSVKAIMDANDGNKGPYKFDGKVLSVVAKIVGTEEGAEKTVYSFKSMRASVVEV